MTRVLIAGFMHETNTFSQLPTTLESYRARGLFYNDEVSQRLKGTKTEIAGFLDSCEKFGWDPVTPVYANATPSGKVTKDTFEAISSIIITSLENDGPFDGVLLALHGAMVCTHVDDGEGELLRLIKERVNPDIPIAITLDLHANVTDEMARLSDIIVIYRTYPHIDQYEIAIEAADLMNRTLKREIKPRCYVRRGKMLDGADHGRTTAPGPMTEALSSTKDLLKSPGILSASVAAGFPWVDIHDTGPSAVIVANGDSPSYAKLVDPIIAQLFESRSRTTVNSLSIENALKIVEDSPSSNKPIVISDFADNPGGGGYGDGTHLLRGIIEAKLKNVAFGTLYDPSAVEICIQQGLGAHVVVAIGGKIDPKYGGPVPVTGKVTAVTDGKFNLDGPMMAGTPVDMGPTVVLDVDGIEIIVTSQRYQVFDLMYFKHARIDPNKKKVVVVKSAHHFRAAYAPISSQILVVDSGSGLTSRNYKKLSYEKVRRPVYPLDFD